MSDAPQFPDWMRGFNKRILNPLTRGFAGIPRGPFALICHVGRRSGKHYETPIMVAPVAGGFVIALTYGPDVDWYRNVLAADQCTVRWHDREYSLQKPEPLDAEIALQVFPAPLRRILKWRGTRDFVKLDAR